MEIRQLSTNSILLKGKDESVLINPSDGLWKKDKKGPRLIIAPGENAAKIGTVENRVVVYGPGNYEVGGIEVTGFRATGQGGIFIIRVDGASIAYVTSLAENLSDKKLERVDNETGGVEVLIVSMGVEDKVENKEKLRWAKTWGANYVIPIGYEDNNNLNQFLDEADSEGKEPQPSLKVDVNDLPEGMEVVVLKPKG